MERGLSDLPQRNDLPRGRGKSWLLRRILLLLRRSFMGLISHFFRRQLWKSVLVPRLMDRIQKVLVMLLTYDRTSNYTLPSTDTELPSSWWCFVGITISTASRPRPTDIYYSPLTLSAFSRTRTRTETKVVYRRAADPRTGWYIEKHIPTAEPSTNDNKVTHHDPQYMSVLNLAPRLRPEEAMTIGISCWRGKIDMDKDIAEGDERDW